MVNSSRLERWFGRDAVENLSFAMKDWYGPPIAVHGAPGSVVIHKGGEFSGKFEAGEETTALDRARLSMRRGNLGRFLSLMPCERVQVAGSFGSLSAIILAATSGKMQNLLFTKSGSSVTATGISADLWHATGTPGQGAIGAAAPAGTIPTSATVGSLPFINPSNANTAHFITGNTSAGTAQSTLLLYDRLFAVAKTMNSTATEAVTGVPTRYQNTSSGAGDYIGGNFCYPVSVTALPATAHNWTVCQYTNQAGTTGQSFQSFTGVSSSAARAVDGTNSNWFMRLADGDSGVKALTQMQCSAALATGSVNFVIGHPIAFMPCPIASMICVTDGINTAFNLAYIYDNAALSFLEINKPSTSATSYSGIITLVAE